MPHHEISLERRTLVVLLLGALIMLAGCSAPSFNFDENTPQRDLTATEAPSDDEPDSSTGDTDPTPTNDDTEPTSSPTSTPTSGSNPTSTPTPSPDPVDQSPTETSTSDNCIVFCPEDDGGDAFINSNDVSVTPSDTAPSVYKKGGEVQIDFSRINGLPQGATAEIGDTDNPKSDHAFAVHATSNYLDSISIAYQSGYANRTNTPDTQFYVYSENGTHKGTVTPGNPLAVPGGNDKTYFVVIRLSTDTGSMGEFSGTVSITGT